MSVPDAPYVVFGTAPPELPSAVTIPSTPYGLPVVANTGTGFSSIAPGTSGNVLISNGTSWTNTQLTITSLSGISIANPSLGDFVISNTGVTALLQGSGISLTASTGSITISAAPPGSNSSIIANTSAAAVAIGTSATTLCSANLTAGTYLLIGQANIINTTAAAKACTVALTAGGSPINSVNSEVLAVSSMGSSIPITALVTLTSTTTIGLTATATTASSLQTQSTLFTAVGSGSENASTQILAIRIA